MTDIDCGDNGCMFRDRTKSSGMRTNGGCRCFGRSLVSTFGIEDARKIHALRNELHELRTKVAENERARSWAEMCVVAVTDALVSSGVKLRDTQGEGLEPQEYKDAILSLWNRSNKN